MNKSTSSILGTMNLYMPSPERKESKVSSNLVFVHMEILLLCNECRRLGGLPPVKFLMNVIQRHVCLFFSAAA